MSNVFTKYVIIYNSSAFHLILHLNVLPIYVGEVPFFGGGISLCYNGNVLFKPDVIFKSSFDDPLLYLVSCYNGIYMKLPNRTPDNTDPNVDVKVPATYAVYL